MAKGSPAAMRVGLLGVNVLTWVLAVGNAELRGMAVYVLPAPKEPLPRLYRVTGMVYWVPVEYRLTVTLETLLLL